MSVPRQSGRSKRALGRALLASLSLLLFSACSVPASESYRTNSSGVTVIGVTAKSGLDAAINRNSLAREFANLLAERRQFQVFPASLLRETIGSTQVDEILDRYARRGQLAQRDTQFLMAAGLRTKYAVIARVENDAVKFLPERREAMVGSKGTRLMDRQRTILATQRVTEVSAILFDLSTGREMWTRHYRVDPVVEAASTVYHGNSFGGSLAAAFTNTMVNGVSVTRQPAAPPLRESLRSLLAEIASKLPVR